MLLEKHASTRNETTHLLLVSSEESRFLKTFLEMASSLLV